MNLPLHMSIVAFDIESYGRRTESEQRELRTAMYAVAREALTATGLDWDDCVLLDRGDSLLALCPPSCSPVLLVDTFTETLTRALTDRAGQPGVPVMRLRLSINVGLATPDENGWVGNAINATCRLLDLPMLRTVLAAADRAPLALILSEELYQATVAQRHTRLVPEACRAVPVAMKELKTQGWISVPGYATPPGITDDAVENAAQEELGPASPSLASMQAEGAIFTGSVSVGNGGRLAGRDFIENPPAGGTR
ncbi:MAG: hypothetical protein HOV77_23995 [Hamadaea sp.]|uniref:hypothetical protein n=1 Tax=Hamadaea sp. TaxID=2024425 RepID=UPI0017EFCB8F|nr:hypothetical protein [Hamadaea sp.]NUT22247.1 hypothetical protein [Hamadaea sp.]